MAAIRPFRPGDEAALAEICLRTADAGADATGILADDGLWARLFVLPYAARHPDLAFVVETDDCRVAGYVVATDDTRAFEGWFRAEWWPRFSAERPRADAEGAVPSRQAALLASADARGAGPVPFADDYPAHLHVDLLPELQGQGWGRRLIDTLVDALRARGVTGLHLEADARKAGAVAFYPRIGFTRLASEPGVVAFGRTL